MFKLKTTLIALALVLPLQSQANFIKYKNYLIPMSEQNQGPCGEREIPAITKASVDNAEIAGDRLPRIFVTTDVGGGDPDDKQSLVHLLSFSEKFKILGFGTSGPSSSGDPTSEQQTSIIKQFIEKYQALPIKPGAADLGYLLDINPVTGNDAITIGSRGRAVPTASQSNETVEAIIRHARCTYFEDGGKPLYVLAWGTTTDVMQALENAKDIRPVVRVVSYSGYNNNSAQDAWFDSPAQSNVWKVEYRGASNHPLKNCIKTDMDILSTKPLGYFNLTGVPSYRNKGGIVFNGVVDSNNTYYTEGNGGGEGFCNGQPYWTKLGDTVTTAFAMRTAENRNNPVNLGEYGIYQIIPNRTTHWELIDGNTDSFFRGIGKIYTTWKNK